MERSLIMRAIKLGQSNYKKDEVNSSRKDFQHRIYGVYEDSYLKSTYFVCDSSLVKNFISIYKRHGFDKFNFDNSSNIKPSNYKSFFITFISLKYLFY